MYFKMIQKFLHPRFPSVAPCLYYMMKDGDAVALPVSDKMLALKGEFVGWGIAQW